MPGHFLEANRQLSNVILILATGLPSRKRKHFGQMRRIENLKVRAPVGKAAPFAERLASCIDAQGFVAACNRHDHRAARQKACEQCDDGK
ncbi:hypothetical protein XH92_24320 [Bradyrhizobium sp. CCBAU 53421]|nr:hypothetical protein XH92_24320 [Bradyrhizobium sp. CCBAU 53421]